jgi:hypothetical protein
MSPTSGGRSVDVFRLRTKGHGVCSYIFMLWQLIKPRDFAFIFLLISWSEVSVSALFGPRMKMNVEQLVKWQLAEEAQALRWNLS